MLNQGSSSRYSLCACSTICTSLLLLLLLLGISSCGQAKTLSQPSLASTSNPTDVDALPHLQKQVPVPLGIAKGVLAPNQQVYFIAYDYVSIFDGLSLVENIQIPKFDSPYGPNLRDIDVTSATGLVYVLDSSADVVNIIHDTELITSLTEIVNEDPFHVVTDQDSGEVYVFYTAHLDEKVESHALVLSGTTIITDIALPLFTNAVAYNPIDDYIYSAGEIITSLMDFENAMMVIDDHQVLEIVHPLDEPQLSVEGIAINETNGDVYILLASKVVYWDRVNPLKSIDLYALGYRNLHCITVDPIRGWAYVCAWTGYPSYALVVDQNMLKEAIPIAYRPQSMAVDTKHDYVYVAHYSPAVMSVIRETRLMTTLDTLGAGATDVVVDQLRILSTSRMQTMAV